MVDKSTIEQGKDFYEYSHADEIEVQGKIWIRHIWVHTDFPDQASRRLMDFEPTEKPAENRTPKLPKRSDRVRDFIEKFGDTS